MSKKEVFFIIVVTVIITWVFTIFPGRFIEAKLSTWPVLNRWKILSPQAPIVITNRQTVRVSDSGDIIQASGQIESKISTVVLVNGSSVTVAGVATNLTSDGSFLTAASVFNSKAPGNYYILLGDGTSAAISQEIPDPATSLVFFKAALNNVPTASLGNSLNIQPGQQVFFAENSLQTFLTKVTAADIVSGENDIAGQVLVSDNPSRSFTVSVNSALVLGQPIIDTNAEVIGLWNGSSVIPSDVLKQALVLYLNNQQSIIRPSFGFSYSILSQNESKLGGMSEGALIKSVNIGGAAAKAGLLQGDIITEVNGQSVNENNPLEPTLQNFNPGDKVTLTVERGKQSLTLNLIVLSLNSNIK